MDYPILIVSICLGKSIRMKRVEVEYDNSVSGDYEANKCQSSVHCIPCNVRFPSCAGLPDGMNAWQGKEWSPHYVVCHQERISQQGMCKAEKESQIFHPDKRTCVQFDEVKDIIG